MRQLNNHLKYGNQRDGSSRQQHELAKEMQGDSHGAARKGRRDTSGKQTKFKGDASEQWKRVQQRLKPGEGVTSEQWCRQRLRSCIKNDHLSLIQ
jgi:hypothetical protein